MTKKVNWTKIRKDFPITEEIAFFQSAGMSPIPTPVYETVCEMYLRLCKYGNISWEEDFEKINKLCDKLGNFINTSGENLTLLPNTSIAFSLVALSLKQHFGDDFNIVTMQDEFPASNVPFAGQKINIKYVNPYPGNRYPIDHIIKAVDHKTKAIVASYVSYNTGFRQDIETLGKKAKEKGLLFIVNATQGFPIFPIDVEKMCIDVMAASLHKWGCAGHVGSLFYTSPGYRKKFPSPFTGWLSVLPPDYDFIPVQKDEKYEQYDSAKQYNFGTMNQQVVLGLKTAFEYMESIGFEQIQNRIFEITDYLIDNLSVLPGKIQSPLFNKDERSGIISIDFSGYDNQKIVAYLKENNVFAAIRNQNVRLSVNFFNDHSDVDKLVEVLQKYFSENN